MISFIKRYALSLIVVAAIVYLSFFKPPEPPQEFDIPNLDKLVHVCMYLGLAGMVWIDHQRGRWQQPLKHGVWAAVLFPLAFGGLVEVLQPTLTSYRGGSWADFLADFVGVMLAWLCAWAIRRRLA